MPPNPPLNLILPPQVNKRMDRPDAHTVTGWSLCFLLKSNCRDISIGTGKIFLLWQKLYTAQIQRFLWQKGTAQMTSICQKLPCSSTPPHPPPFSPFSKRPPPTHTHFTKIMRGARNPNIPSEIRHNLMKSMTWSLLRLRNPFLIYFFQQGIFNIKSFS